MRGKSSPAHSPAATKRGRRRLYDEAVQQALIHHYFGDKEGLHGEVVRSGLAAMTEGVWELLSRMDAPPKAPKASTAAKQKRKAAVPKNSDQSDSGGRADHSRRSSP